MDFPHTYESACITARPSAERLRGRKPTTFPWCHPSPNAVLLIGTSLGALGHHRAATTQIPCRPRLLTTHQKERTSTNATTRSPAMPLRAGQKAF